MAIRKFRTTGENSSRASGDIEFRVGTFSEDIFRKDNVLTGEQAKGYEFDVIFYYVKDAPAAGKHYYYDNIDYKYSNTFDTIAEHLASGHAEVTLYNLVDAMKPDEHIYLYGILDPICTKQTLMDRVDVRRQEIDAADDAKWKAARDYADKHWQEYVDDDDDGNS